MLTIKGAVFNNLICFIKQLTLAGFLCSLICINRRRKKLQHLYYLFRLTDKKILFDQFNLLNYS